MHFLTPFSAGGRVGHGGKPGRHGEVCIRLGGPAEATTFQWQDMLRGELRLMSLANHRYLLAQPRAKSLCAADAPGTTRRPLERGLFQLGSGGRQIAEGLPSSEQQALASALPSLAEALGFHVQ